MIADVVDVAWRVARALEECEVDYYIGGSVASSLQSMARSTNDIDFVVDLKPTQVAAFTAALGPEFDVDQVSLEDAARRRTSWNIFHLPTALKIDLMMRKSTPYDVEAFSRRKRFRIDVDVEPYLKTVEDSVLKKLEWFAAGGHESTRQWRDVVELLRVNARTLDEGYLHKWAAHLGVAELVSKARAEALTPRD